MQFLKSFVSAFQHRSSRCVLFAWELGGGLGHVNRLLAVGGELSIRGLRFVFVVRNTRTDSLITKLFPGAEILAAPVFRPAFDAPLNRGPAHNYADMLFQCGYEDADITTALVEQWRLICDEFKPALIICDHSPTLVLAAAGRVPLVHIGSGFAIPPVGEPFLSLSEKSHVGAREREDRVLRSIQQVRRVSQRPIPSHVSQIMEGAHNFPCCLPQLDPYRAVRASPAMGPIGPLPKPTPASDQRVVFGYLTAEDIDLREILESLVRAKIICRIYVRGGTAPFEEIVQNSTVILYDQPQPLANAMAGACAVLHHGGLATTETALAIGRPQFLLPRHLEQLLTADSVERLGCGINLRSRKIDVGTQILRLLRERRFESNASRIAAELVNRPANAKLAVTSACLQYLQ